MTDWATAELIIIDETQKFIGTGFNNENDVFEVDGILYKHPRVINPDVIIWERYNPSRPHFSAQPMISLKDDLTNEDAGETAYRPEFTEGEVCDRCWIEYDGIVPVGSWYCTDTHKRKDNAKS